MSVTEKSSEWSFTQSEYDWIQRRLGNVEKKVKLLIGLLVDKKVIGEELGDRLVEETTKDSDIIKWFLREKELN